MEQSQQADRLNSRNFKPSVYRHYKGGTYTALHIVRYHDSEEEFVVYVSHTYGGINIREWATAGKDSWTDFVEVPVTRGGELTSDTVPRFKYLGLVLS